MKLCPKCGESKELSFYYNSKYTKDGKHGWCKVCVGVKTSEYKKTPKGKSISKAYSSKPENKIKRNQKTKEKYNNDTKFKESIKLAQSKYNRSEKGREAQRKARKTHKEYYQEYGASWKVANRAKCNAVEAKRRAAKQSATPIWLTEDHHKEIQEFYILAKELSWLFNGEVLEVDHIIPLKGKNVCGLHVPWNLQLLPEIQNIKKGNR